MSRWMPYCVVSEVVFSKRVVRPPPGTPAQTRLAPHSDDDLLAVEAIGALALDDSGELVSEEGLRVSVEVGGVQVVADEPLSVLCNECRRTNVTLGPNEILTARVDGPERERDFRVEFVVAGRRALPGNIQAPEEASPAFASRLTVPLADDETLARTEGIAPESWTWPVVSGLDALSADVEFALGEFSLQSMPFNARFLPALRRAVSPLDIRGLGPVRIGVVPHGLKGPRAVHFAFHGS